MSIWERIIAAIAGIAVVVGGFYSLGAMDQKLDELTKDVEDLEKNFERLHPRIALLNLQNEGLLAAITPKGVETTAGTIRSVDLTNRTVVLTDAGGDSIELSVPENQQFGFSKEDIGKVYFFSTTSDSAGNRILQGATTSPQEFAAELKREREKEYIPVMYEGPPPVMYEGLPNYDEEGGK